jgi:hypothetical protein
MRSPVSDHVKVLRMLRCGRLKEKSSLKEETARGGTSISPGAAMPV